MRNFFKIPDYPLEIFRAGSIGPAVGPVAPLADQKIEGRALDIGEPARSLERQRVLEQLAGVEKLGHLPLQLGAMVLDAAEQVDELTVGIVEYLLGRVPLAGKQQPSGPAERLDIP